MNSTKKYRLDFWTCFFINSDSNKFYTEPDLADFENSTNVSVLIVETSNYYCKAHGSYLVGHGLTLWLALLTALIGIFGVLTNAGTIYLLRNTINGKEPANFMKGLALLSMVDLVLCLSKSLFSFLTVLILENLSRSCITMHLFRLCIIVCTITRTMSVYTTIILAIERYIVVSYPLKSQSWTIYRPWKCRLTLLAVLIFAIFVKIPWNCQSTIKPNGYYEENILNPSKHDVYEEIRSFPYLILRNSLGKDFPRRFKQGLLVLDVLVPFPILVIFNVLAFKRIHQWNKKRSALKSSQKRELNAARMLLVVVLVLLSEHLFFCIVYFTNRYISVVYRELLLLQSLGVVFGATVNFLLYYNLGSTFRQEFWRTMVSVFGTRSSWITKHFEKHCGINGRKSCGNLDTSTN